VWEVVVNLIVVFTKYDTLVTEIIYEGDLDESTEQGWQNAEREADSVFEECPEREPVGTHQEGVWSTAIRR